MTQNKTIKEICSGQTVKLSLTNTSENHDIPGNGAVLATSENCIVPVTYHLSFVSLFFEKIKSHLDRSIRLNFVVSPFFFWGGGGCEGDKA